MAETERLGRSFWTRVFLPLVTTAVVLFGFLGMSAFASLPSNVIATRSPQDHVRLAFNILASQDYAFFTKNPESDALELFGRSGGSVVDRTTTPQNRPANLLGLSRLQRAQGPELANLSNQENAAWVRCPSTATPTSCLDQAFARHPTSVADTSTVPTACGDVVLADVVPVPWSFRDLVPYEHKVTQTAHLEVTCAP